MQVHTLARLLLGTTLGIEGGTALHRFRRRRLAFEAAARRAKETGRPLIVVGDPDAGLHTRLLRAYECGDLCIDIEGCPRCQVMKAADLTKGPIEGIADDSAVVFVSCVLEYVVDLEAALQEISRMAGSAENAFIVTVQPWTLTARLYPHARWRLSSPTAASTVALERVGFEEKLAATAVLGVLAAAAFWPKGRR